MPAADGQELLVEQLQSIDAVKNCSIDLCAVSLEANLLGILSSDGKVKLYDIPTLKEKRTLPSISARVNTLSFSASGHTLALGAADGKVYLFDTNTPADPKNYLLIHSESHQ